MRIEVRIVPDEGRDNVAEKDRQVVHVETHARRNDAFNIQKVDDIHEGHDAVQFTVPNGGRLVINTPFTGGDVVYDPEQAAAVRPSQQQNDEGRADKVSPTPTPTSKPLGTAHPAPSPSKPNTPAQTPPQQKQ